MLPVRVEDHVTNTNTRHEKSTLEVLVKVVKEAPSTF